MRPFIAILFLTMLASCDSKSPEPVVDKTHTVTHASSYTDPAKQQRFKEALTAAGIRFETMTKDGAAYAQWSGEDNSKVEDIKHRLFGPPPPDGRSIHFNEPYQTQFKQWLAEKGIGHKTAYSDGKEHVVWETADYERVAEWEHFPRESFEKANTLSSAR